MNIIYLRLDFFYFTIIYLVIYLRNYLLVNVLNVSTLFITSVRTLRLVILN